MTRRLWIGGYGPEKSAHGDGLAAFRDEVESGSNGEVEVEVTWNIMDEGRPNTDLFDLVEAGHMFLCYFSSSYLGSRVPELNVLETPFLFPDLETAHRSLDGDLGQALAGAVRSKTGFEVLGFWDNGFRHMTNRLRPIHRPEDCKGMTVRMQPNAIHEELIRSWGAIPVAVELSAAIQLIVRLDVDAQENPLANTVAYGVDQVHRHVTMTGHLYGARGLFAHRATLQSFHPDLRRVVQSAARTAIDVQRKAASDLETTLRARLEADGVEFVDLTDDERSAFVAASGPAIDRAHHGVPEELFELARS
ncbi:MAG TPA: TRAP transporter substrate-binding protein DctP [Acidimicrobiia bacterium]|nr:TRAP transporter substrate-binding protein DctP [Acidimicrobiia bacterium]